MRIAKRTISIIVFVFIAIQIFAHISYLYRNTEERDRFVEYTEEVPDSVDVVVVGSSLVFRYFDTMQAWHDHGFTSFDYTCSGMPAGVATSAIRELYKTQNPSVVAVNVCGFLSSTWGGAD